MMIETVRELVRGGEIGIVCLGGVILVGMADWIQEACILELGEVRGRSMRIVDQLLAGVVTLEGLVALGVARNFNIVRICVTHVVSANPRNLLRRVFWSET